MGESTPSSQRGLGLNPAVCQDRTQQAGLVSPTWSGMTIMKIFLSLSERMCLMKAQPVPMSAMVMNSSAPFKLKQKTFHGRKRVSSDCELDPTARSTTARAACKRRVANSGTSSQVSNASFQAHKETAMHPTT